MRDMYRYQRPSPRNPIPEALAELEEQKADETATLMEDLAACAEDEAQSDEAW